MTSIIEVDEAELKLGVSGLEKKQVISESVIGYKAAEGDILSANLNNPVTAVQGCPWSSMTVKCRPSSVTFITG
jgi:predicted metalloenzyme YecM